jgi:selenocysteine lyase/cysteine desulfurase
MAELRFVVVDGAQAVNHVPLDLARDYCDFLVAGCHKWLRAFTPMGIGFFGHPRSREYISSAVARWTVNGTIDDPLLEFSQELENETPAGFGETVNVSALLSSHGATLDALQVDASRLDDAAVVNRQRVVAYAREAGWKWLAPYDDFASRIVVLRSADKRVQRAKAEQLRRRFLNYGLSLTAYESGVIRISLPAEELSDADLVTLKAALSHAEG